MRKNESITHLMTTNPVTATPGEKFSTLRKLMEDNHIHHLPVVEGTQVVGVVSRTDVLGYTHSRAFVKEGEADESLDETVNAQAVMTKAPLTLKSSDTVRHAVEILNDNSFNSIPVVSDGSKQLVGMVTTKDLLAYLVAQY